MRGPWGRIALGLMVLLALKQHLTHLLDPWRIDGDARQHVFWTGRFQDPALFAGDLLVRFISSPRFDPPGYQALYAAGVQVFDPLFFSKLVGLLLCLPAGICAFRIGRRLHSEAAGVLMILIAGFLVFDNLRGGLPRAFAFPILLFFLDALVHRNRFGSGLAFLASALFYPPLVLTMGAVLPLLVLDGRRLRPAPWRSLLLGLGLPLVLAFLVILWSYGSEGEDLAGPMVTRDEAQAMPEFHAGGRSEFWVDDPVAFWLGDWSYNRSACGLLSNQVAWPLLGVLVLALVLRRRFRVPREAAALLLTGAALFIAAHLLLFRLFLPSRYTIYAWPAALLVLWVAFRRELAMKPKNIEAFLHLNEQEALEDPLGMRKILIVLVAVILLFFLHGALSLKPATIALGGAAAALLWVRPDIEEALKQIEWSVLLFFAGLFVITGGLEAAGVLRLLADIVAGPAQTNLLGASLLLLWLAAIVSAVVDNIPFTIALIPVIQELGALGIGVAPLWWALALGAGLGGNGTPIGATANVVTVALSAKTRTPITTRIWVRSGLPVMLVTCVIASLLFALFFGWMSTP